MALYLGESAGARVIQVGTGLTSVGTNHQGDVQTWDVSPAGEMGDCLFRSIGVSFTATNGWSLGITVLVDGVSLGEKTFGGLGATENGQAQVYVKKRGARIAIRTRTLARSGQWALTDIQVSFLPIRQWP